MRRMVRVQLLFTLGVLMGSLALLGCPRQPDMNVAAPVLPASAPPPKAAPAGKPEEAEPAIAPAPKPTEEDIAVNRPTPPVEFPENGSASAEGGASLPLKDIFFEFDNANIPENQKPILNEDFALLKSHPNVKISIQGNCDERGTEEYNLALGERRAQALKSFLVAQGIPADRIQTITYGKDRPFVLGHDEVAWKLNRRGHFEMAAR